MANKHLQYPKCEIGERDTAAFLRQMIQSLSLKGFIPKVIRHRCASFNFYVSKYVKITSWISTDPNESTQLGTGVASPVAGWRSASEKRRGLSLVLEELLYHNAAGLSISLD